MQLYKRNDSAKWWVGWNDQNGKRHRRSTGTEDKKLAEALAAKWVKDGFLEEHFGKKPEVPFEEALLRYAKTHKRGPSSNVRAGYPLPPEAMDLSE